MTNTKFYYSKNWSLLLVSLFCVAESINLSVKCLFRHSKEGLLWMKNEDETLALDQMRTSYLCCGVRGFSTQLLEHFVSILDAPTMKDSCSFALL